MPDQSAHIRVAVTDEPLDPSKLISEVGRPFAGAIALFLGTVRDHSEGRSGVTHLEYESYREHVTEVLAEVAGEAVDKWPISVVAVEHRLGRVEVGEPSVAVAVSAPHRAEAFEAARYVIDELKARAPIWKQEHWPGGAEWVEGA